MKKHFTFFPLLIFLIFFCSSNIFAQGVTTAAMNGFVTDNQGNALPGANVIALHTPSGTRYGAATRENGVFNLPNLKIGGPYTITVSFVGFNKLTEENVFLNIGQTLNLDFALTDESVELGELVVTAEKDNILNSSRTGAEIIDQSR